MFAIVILMSGMSVLSPPQPCATYRGGIRVRGLCLGFTNPVETGGVWDMCLCLDCGGVGGKGDLAWARV